MASSSSSFMQQKYQVFLSFGGKNTNHNFIGHLYEAVKREGIDIFIADELVQREGISAVLPTAIEQSMISIIVFSKNYASSMWCLDELCKILESKERNGQIVVPIFYHVDPSDIRKQKGDVGTALAEHKKRLKDSKVKRWKAALKEASNLCGWDFRNNNGHEATFILQVVEDILNKSTPAHLSIYIYPIGYDTCNDYLNLFLQAGSDDVIIAGICGASGMGKTAIARAIYERISHTFEGSCFLTGFGGHSKMPNGLAQLQEKLILDLLQAKVIKVPNVDRGVDMIRENLCHKKVLIVLDDVDDLVQLFALVGERNWFGAGSKVIITSRNVQLLEMFEVDEIFTAQGLPPPPNIKAIWERFQQSRHTIAGLMEYIQNFNHLANDKLRYLEDCLLREKQKNPIQAQIIQDLQPAQSKDSASTSCTEVEDAIMHGYDANCRWINSNNEAECGERKIGGDFGDHDMENENNLLFSLESGQSTERKG